MDTAPLLSALTTHKIAKAKVTQAIINNQRYHVGSRVEALYEPATRWDPLYNIEQEQWLPATITALAGDAFHVEFDHFILKNGVTSKLHPFKTTADTVRIQCIDPGEREQATGSSGIDKWLPNPELFESQEGVRVIQCTRPGVFEVIKQAPSSIGAIGEEQGIAFVPGQLLHVVEETEKTVKLEQTSKDATEAERMHARKVLLEKPKTRFDASKTLSEGELSELTNKFDLPDEKAKEDILGLISKIISKWAADHLDLRGPVSFPGVTVPTGQPEIEAVLKQEFRWCQCTGSAGAPDGDSEPEGAAAGGPTQGQQRGEPTARLIELRISDWEQLKKIDLKDGQSCVEPAKVKHCRSTNIVSVSNSLMSPSATAVNQMSADVNLCALSVRVLAANVQIPQKRRAQQERREDA
eukprot:SAG11_NODE_4526_length_1864_cov_1.312748_2_plen_410_part_00